MADTNWPSFSHISLQTLISGYTAMQASMISRMHSISGMKGSVNPGAFILLQFQMSQITQVGESVSNIVSAVNKIISNAVANLRGG